jgi:hypothetical protein
MARGFGGELNPPASEEGVAADEKPVGPLARKSCEGSINLPASAGMQRYVDGNLLSGFSSTVLVGRDLVDVKCIGWQGSADTIAGRPHIPRLFKYKADYILVLRFFYSKKATSNLTIRLSSLFRSLRTAVCRVPTRRRWTKPSLR